MDRVSLKLDFLDKGITNALCDEMDVIASKQKAMMEELDRAFRPAMDSYTSIVMPIIEQQAEMERRVAEMLAPTVRVAAEISNAMRPYLEQVARTQEAVDSLTKSITSPSLSLSTCIFREEPVVYVPRGPAIVRLDPDSMTEMVQKVVAILREDSKPTRVKAWYPLPKEAVWGKLRFKFIDGHTVKVKYPTLHAETFDFKQLGFLNRKTNGPDIKWEFLRALARYGGSVTNHEFDRRFNRTTKYETAKRLKAFFGMSEDPFEDYTKKNGYRLKFAIFSDSDSAFEDDE